jgi:hypothetical protein
LAKTYGIKIWCYWEQLVEHIGNLMKKIRNYKKIKSLPYTLKTQKKKHGHSWLHVEPFDLLDEIYI